MNGDWRSYNPIAASYAQCAEELYFARPAKELVSLLELTPRSRLLDVGTGTGAVASAAAAVLRPDGLVVGVDPALEAVRLLRGRIPLPLVAGILPYLPLADDSFDAVAAAFVLTHVPDYVSALSDMLRVARSGGRVAVSAWVQSPSNTPQGNAWQQVVSEFMDVEQLRAASLSALPWEVQFSDPAFVAASLVDSGLRDVEVRSITYHVTTSIDSFIASRSVSLTARFMAASLGRNAWSQFLKEARRRMTDAFPDQVAFEVVVNFGVGTKG